MRLATLVPPLPQEIASQTIKQIINDFANQPTPTSDLLSLLKTTHNLSSEGYTLISSTLTNLVSLVAISMPQLLKEWEEEVLNLEPALFRLVIQSEEFGLENKGEEKTNDEHINVNFF